MTEREITKLESLATGLAVEEAYEFRVAAENKAGVGPFSESSTSVKAKEPIGKSWYLLCISEHILLGF